nr:Peptidase C1A domain containing protein [Haemonchus contortus]
MECLWLLLCLCIYRAAKTNVDAAHEIPLEAKMLSGEALVEYLKKNQDLFEVNSDPTPGFESKLMDIKFKNDDAYTVVKDDPDPGDDIPENYDPRKIWTNCTSLFTIRDQANCGSCWAVSTAAAISDRICIATKGEKQVYISATDIMTCCTRPCGHGSRGYHAVKIIGWGKENGTDYWLIANSWHNDWGENGFFRILRGTNHCGIEEKVSGGLVDVNSL